MLAPGLMISACALLLLGMNNKYSLVVNRIRTLNIEFRGLQNEHKERRDSILIQLPLLIQRMKIIRNAVLLYTIAIAFFIFSILSIGLFILIQQTALMDVSGDLFHAKTLSEQHSMHSGHSRVAGGSLTPKIHLKYQQVWKMVFRQCSFSNLKIHVG